MCSGVSVMAKQTKMSFFDFQNLFSDESACESYLFQNKWPNGFTCPVCGAHTFYRVRTRRLPLYTCKHCGHQTTAMVGTVMERSHTDLRKWFWAIYLSAQDKRGISAVILSQQVGVTYKTAWLMLHKIRHAMSVRDARYRLAGLVELDDAFFGAPTEGSKRGRGTEKATVVVGLSLHANGHPQYAKMQVVPNVQGKTLKGLAEKALKPGATIHTDGFRSYQALSDKGFDVQGIKFDPKTNPDHLHGLHTIISNAKAFIGGTYHGLDKKHLQAYLDEFCYRFNRRHFEGELFHHPLSSCAVTLTVTYHELTG